MEPVKSFRQVILILALFTLPCALWADQPAVRVEPPHLQGPRPLKDETATAVVRDYLESWQSMRSALAQNRADVLDRDFIGTARTKLTDTIHDQTKLGLHTHYRDRAHDIQIVFYSPEGLSIQLTDNVDYDEQVLDHDKILTTQRVHARYIVVMTPAELRWKVRILQAQAE